MRAERKSVHQISIGRFAGLTGISANTLRRYDEVGLLSAAFADPLTGYRLYAIEQLDDGILIRLLRDLDVPLDEVKSLMAAVGPDDVRAAPVHHRKRIVERHAELERILARIDAAFEDARGLLPYELELVLYHDPVQWYAGLDVEVRQPVKRAVAEALGGRRLPGCAAMQTAHLGPWDDRRHGCAAMLARFARKSYEIAGPVPEFYRVDERETGDPQRCVTEITWPVQRRATRSD